MIHTKPHRSLTKLSARALGVLTALGLATLSASSFAHPLDDYQLNKPVKLPQKSTADTAVQAPNLGSGVNFYEQYRNKEIALWSLRQVNKSLSLIDDPWSVQVLWTMTAQMNGLVRTQPLVAVPLINDNSMNAFAVPGGLIGMNTGTILSAGELDEVASVLAHEIAHLSQRHYEHRTENNKKLLAVQLGGLLAALAASAVSGDATLAVMAGSQTLAAESMAAHSREHEREADRVGQQILASAGYDARAMPRFFHRLYKQVSLNQSSNGFAPSFMQSHPFTMERLSESTSRASAYPAVSMSQKQAQATLFDAWYWRIKYLSKQANFNELSVNAKHSRGAMLAFIMYLADTGQYAQAQKLYHDGKFNGDDVLPALVQAHIFALQHDYDGAINVLSGVQAIYPERRDLKIYLAQYLTHSHQPQKALALLEPLVQDVPHDRQAWQGIWRAYERQARHDDTPKDKDVATIYALQARSQVELWGGQYQGALQSNAQAVKIANQYADLTTLKRRLQQDKENIILARDFKIGAY